MSDRRSSHPSWRAVARGCTCPSCSALAATPHGTQPRYEGAGCRCADCRRWAADKRARYRASSATGGDMLPTLCWCESTVLDVPAADVRAGRTATCGAIECKPGVAA